MHLRCVNVGKPMVSRQCIEGRCVRNHQFKAMGCIAAVTEGPGHMLPHLVNKKATLSDINPIMKVNICSSHHAKCRASFTSIKATLHPPVRS